MLDRIEKLISFLSRFPTLTIGFLLLVLTIFSISLSFFINPNIIQIIPSIGNSQDNHNDNLLTPTNPTNLVQKQYLIPVVSFSSLKDAITLNELRSLSSNLYYLRSNQPELEKILGTQLSNHGFEDVDQILTSFSKNNLAIIPFDQLKPDLKVLTLDGKNILDKSYTGEDWPLTITGSSTNRDSQNLSTLMMTGVTAISRGVEYEIASHHDVLYPARGVMDELKKADLTHVDSENPFFDNCKPEKEGMILCGKSRSIAALEAIGTDIVDLTGNHQNDYGPEKDLESIGHLEDAGFSYFGGGKNEQDAAKILYKTINGTKLAFLGYNYFDSLNGFQYRSLAYKDRPGSNYYSEEKMKADIAQARQNANIVIVDFQFIEQYQTEPLSSQKETFRKAIDFGADIVVGVQSHQPQKIEFYQGKIIFYGLGNFFFDQMWSLPTRQGIIPRFTFYNGKLLSIEILTTLLYDYSQPRLTTGSERTDLLKQILP